MDTATKEVRAVENVREWFQRNTLRSLWDVDERAVVSVSSGGADRHLVLIVVAGELYSTKIQQIAHKSGIPNLRSVPAVCVRVCKKLLKYEHVADRT